VLIASTGANTSSLTGEQQECAQWCCFTVGTLEVRKRWTNAARTSQRGAHYIQL